MYKKTTKVEDVLINEWLFPKTTVILISGKVGVGKTTAARYIQDYLLRNITGYSYITHFATGVKKVAYLMGWDGQKNKKGRQFLQKVGNLGRWYRGDAWVNFMLKHLRETVPEELLDVIVVDDWRFPNEANYFFENERFKVFTINIKAPPERELLRGTDEWEDISETSLDNYKYFNYIIENYDTMEVFEYDVINVLLDIIKESKQGGKP
jgi:dephospho-CoA kinase